MKIIPQQKGKPKVYYCDAGTFDLLSKHLKTIDGELIYATVPVRKHDSLIHCELVDLIDHIEKRGVEDTYLKEWEIAKEIPEEAQYRRAYAF